MSSADRNKLKSGDPLEHLESIITRSTHTRGERIAAAARGGLAQAVSLLTPSQAVAIITGFSVPTERGFEPETDGPPGAAALATFLAASGQNCIVVTDAANSAVCRAAIEAYADLPNEIPDLIVVGDSLRSVVNVFRHRNIKTVVYVERAGPNGSGRYLSMRGIDISSVTAPLDLLLCEVESSVGIGDGGNEVGMGRLPRTVVASISDGLLIHCVTKTDALIVGGTSVWGAWALIAALSLQTGTSISLAKQVLSTRRFERCLDLMVSAGAVDGVRGRRTSTIDGLTPDVHLRILSAIRSLLDAFGS